MNWTKSIRALAPLVALALGGCSPVSLNARDVQLGLESFFSEHQPGNSYDGQFIAVCAQVSDFRAESTDTSGNQIAAVRFAGPPKNKGTKDILWRLRFWRQNGVWKLSYHGDVSKLPCKTVPVGQVTDATYASSEVRDLDY